MKKNVTIIFLTVILGSMLCSCERDGEAGKNVPPEPYFSIDLVKFTDDKYSELILAEHRSTLVTMRGGTPPVVEELIVGKSPYTTKLSNGYWVVDWKWDSRLYYPPSTIMLPYKWETLMHWQQRWDMPDNTQPLNACIADYAGVYRLTIDNLLSVNTDINVNTPEWHELYLVPMVWAQNYLSEKDIREEEEETYYRHIHMQDSLHAIYVQRLIQIIDNGDFDKVYNVYPKGK